MATQQEAKAAKYVAVGRVIFRAKGDGLGEKEPLQTFNPGDPINADFSDAEIKRMLDKGSIKLANVAKAEDEAREQARAAQEEADRMQQEADAQAAAASGNATPNGTEADAAIAAGGGGKAKK